MRVAIKICGLTRPDDVKAAIDAGADALGFVLDEGRVQIDIETARVLLDVARSHQPAERSVQSIAVVGPAGMDLLDEAQRLGFDGIQVVAGAANAPAPSSGFLLPVFFDGPDVLERVERWTTRHGIPTAAAGSGIGGLINIDSAQGGGSGTQADWKRVARVAHRWPTMLAGGLTPDNVAEAIARVRPRAVDVSSGVEATARAKDPAKLRAFVRAAKRALTSPA